MGLRMAVTLAAQGVMKKHPTSRGSAPCFWQNSRLATMAASSMGWRMSMIWEISSGNRTWISRVMAGQAEEITG